MNLHRLLRPLVLTLACAPICLPAAAQTSSAANRIVAPVDETQLVTLRGNVHPLAQARFDRGAAPGTTATGRILLELGRSPAQQQALTQYLADVQNPSSPQYHKWLTPAQYGGQFGISDSDLQTVEGWLQSHGFKIEKVPQARNIIEFSGNFAQIQSAFHTSIHTLAVNGTTHFGNMGDPQIPAALAPVIAGVGPLNDFHPKPTLARGPAGRYNTATHSIQPTFTLFNGTTPLLFVDPADAATIYDTPNTKLNANYKSGTTWDGTGVKIGIAGDSDVNTTDVSNYRVAFLNQANASTNIPTVVVDGDDPGYNGDEVEALLDNEVAGGLAPGASLYFYTSASSDLSGGLFNAIIRALDDNTVSILNISFGGCEADQGSSGNLEILETAEQAAAQGISVTVSTGDSGSAGCDNDNTETAAQNGLAVNGLASTPYNIAVGGTDYDVLATAFTSYVNDATSGAAPYWGTATKYIPEEPWNDSTSVNTSIADNVALNNNGSTLIVAGGGGSSVVYQKPAFQSSLTPNDNARDLPDVSFLAANGLYNATWVVCGDNQADGESATLTSYDCLESGGSFTNDSTFIGVGGTSASAPAFAGILALVSQSQGGARLGQADDILYLLAQSKYSTVFHDITTGDNSVVCVSGSTNCGSNDFLTGYNAGTGYDLASGLGSVDVKNLITDWTTVKLASTSTSLELNNSTSAYTGTHGAAINFSVGVNPTSATGVVGIIDTANENAGGALNNGQFAIPLTSGAGTMSYNGLPGGKYTVSARYGGDTANAASTSVAISVNISAEASDTALVVNAYNPLTGSPISTTSIPYGSLVIADAQISGAAEGANTEGLATGSVAFINGSTTLGTANVGSTGNIASWPPVTNGGFVALPAGTYNMTAKYSGDASYSASTSTAVAFTVVKDPVTLSAQASPGSVIAGQSTSVSFNITVPVNDGLPPTGTVQLTANGKTLYTFTNLQVTYNSGSTPYWQMSGSTNISSSQLTPGTTNTVVVTYSGDTNYQTATQNVPVIVQGGVGSFKLTDSGNITATIGTTGSTTLTLTPAGGFTGTVLVTCAISGNPAITCVGPTLYVTSATAVTGTLQAETIQTTPPGSYTATVTATDQLTGTIKSSLTVTITVTGTSTPTLIVTAAPELEFPAGAKTGNTATITVTPSGGFTGSVNLTCANDTSFNPGGASPPTCTITSPVNISGTTAATSTLTVVTTDQTSPDGYQITINAADAATGKITATAYQSVAVGSPAPATLKLTNSGNITVNAGASTGNTSTITITPAGGYTGTVNLSCAVTTSITNPNDPPTCSLPSTVTVSGATAVTATLTVNTTASSTTALHSPLDKFFLGGGATLAMLLFIGMPARRRAWRGLLSIAAILCMAGAIGCGSSGGGGGGTQTIPGTTAGTYTVTVTGTDSATSTITSNTAVTVTVN